MRESVIWLGVNQNNGASFYDDSEDLLLNLDDNKFRDFLIRILQSIISIIDDRINRRLKQEDVLRVYSAKIISVNLSNKVIGTVYVSDTSETLIKRDVVSIAADSITVEYDGYQYVSIPCSLGQVFTEDDVGKYVKIGTYDDINYYVLHRI